MINPKEKLKELKKQKERNVLFARVKKENFVALKKLAKQQNITFQELVDIAIESFLSQVS